MDTVPGDVLNFQIYNIILKVPGVITIEEIAVHRFGSYLVVNITVGIDENSTVKKGDAIVTKIENLLYSNIEFLRRIYVHYHPASK